MNINPDTEIDTFPIVGIGASAGGLNAFTQLLKALPIDTGMAFVLVQHLDPKHVSLLPDLIKRITAMSVIEISDNLRVEPNHIYVMPPTYSLALLHGVLQLLPRPDVRGKFMPIDDFLTSLAQDRKNHAIGVILSGTASDGTLGIRAIKTVGGITFAQTEDSAEYNGMPHSAIADGHVDFILTPKEIAQKLVQIVHHPYLKQQLNNLVEDVPTKETDLNKIFLLLRTRTGIDFTYYKHTTILRRIKRRMLLHQLDEMKNYAKFLRLHPKELDILFQDMLINVTSFFRDPETFEVLKKEIFPRLNLICCRNLLIYLNTSLQKKVLNTFYYALRPDGFLMLGTSEMIGSEVNLFSLIDSKNKIYLRKSQEIWPNTDSVKLFYTSQSFSTLQSHPKDTSPAIQVQQAAENIILEKYWATSRGNRPEYACTLFSWPNRSLH